jgi:hypothetical protein
VKDLLPTGKGTAGSFSLPVRTDTISRQGKWRSAPTAENIHANQPPVEDCEISDNLPLIPGQKP